MPYARFSVFIKPDIRKCEKLAERIIRAEKRSQKIKKNNLKKKQFEYTKTADSVQGALWLAT